ncbi:MAG: DUF4168 domain-containing protein [Cyanobacteria bacterium P01_D01_bin.105]
MVVQNRHRALVAIALTAFTLTQVSRAYAQNFTDTEIANYARAAVEIEAARQATYEEASDILAAADGNTSILETRLGCNATRMSDMPDLSRPDKIDVRTVLVNFCNSAREIADAHALTTQQFNQITAAHRDDSALAERIQAEIAGLSAE